MLNLNQQMEYFSINLKPHCREVIDLFKNNQMPKVIDYLREKLKWNALK